MASIVGAVLSAAAVVFVAYQFVTADWSVLQGQSVLSVAIGTLFAAALYAASGGLLALAWWRLLSASSALAMPALPCTAIYARTQVYKYLPTNVLHLVGRHASARVTGASHAALLSAAALEFAGLLTAAGLVIAVSGAEGLARYSSQASLKLSLGTPSSVVAVVAAALALGAIGATLFLRSADFGALVKRHIGAFATALALYALFFAMSGTVLWVLALGATDYGASGLRSLVAVVTTAWLLGFVVPGAPAGLGIREAVMIAMLAPHFGEANALLLALLYRITTVGGDAVFAAFGLYIARGSAARD